MSEVCKNWNIVLKDNSVWKPILLAHFANYLDDDTLLQVENSRHGYYNQFKHFIGVHTRTSFLEEVNSYRKENCLRIPSTTLLIAVGTLFFFNSIRVFIQEHFQYNITSIPLFGSYFRQDIWKFILIS